MLKIGIIPVHQKNLKSLIKDLRIDSFNTADSLQKICFFSNNNNNNLSPTRSLSTSTSKKRFVSTYLKSVTKEEEIISYENIDEAKKDFTENIKLKTVYEYSQDKYEELDEGGYSELKLIESSKLVKIKKITNEVK